MMNRKQQSTTGYTVLYAVVMVVYVFGLWWLFT